MVIAFALLIAAKMITVQVPFFFKAVVDRLSEPESAALALPLAALLAYGLARLCASGFSELRDAIFAKVAETAGRLVSLRVFSHLFSLSLRYHLERRTGELARVIERGVVAITFLLGIVLFNIGPTLFEFALVIGILLVKYSWPFAFVAFVTIVAYAVFTFVASEWRIGIRREMNERDNEVSAQSVDSLLNYETVKTFTNEGFERDRLDRTLALYQSAAIRSQTSLAALNFGQAGIIAVGVTVIMILAAPRRGRRRHDGRRRGPGQYLPPAALPAAQLPGRGLPPGQAVADRPREPDGPARSGARGQGSPGRASARAGWRARSASMA